MDTRFPYGKIMIGESDSKRGLEKHMVRVYFPVLSFFRALFQAKEDDYKFCGVKF